MESNLLLFLLLLTVNELNSIEIDSKENNQLSLVKDNPYGQSIVAYYVGSLQNKKRPNESHNVQLQLKLWTDNNKKRIYVQADKWNEKYSKSDDFELDFYYDGNRQWCDIYDECSSPFAKKNSTFKLDLNTKDGNFIHLLYFDYFNNSFTLNQPIGKCTKNQLSGLNDQNTPDLNILTSCVCCDDYDPDELLGCPNNKWSNKQGTTCNPQTTPQPITMIPPAPKNITCKSVIGYYNGIFKNIFNPKTMVNVEFQILFYANDTSEYTSSIIDQWNSQKANINEFFLDINDFESHIQCKQINATDCLIPYAMNDTDTFQIMIEYYSRQTVYNEYQFLSFPDFNNTFTLTNAVEQCTKHQIQLKNLFTTNESLYEYCLCCGTEYKPHPSLECPKNPWT